MVPRSALALLALLPAVLAVDAAWNETVQTTYGVVQGETIGDVSAVRPPIPCPCWWCGVPGLPRRYRRASPRHLQVIYFHSIPFASPPVGNLRFAVSRPS